MFHNNYIAVVFGVLLSFIRILSITGLTTQTMWQIKQELYEYDSYASVQLTKFTVPTLAFHSTWLFSSYASHKECEMLKGFVSIQYGGIPLVSPKNETYPPFFHLHRSHQVMLEFNTDNSTLSYRLENPVAGNWFALSVLDDISTERMKQKGIGIDCHYYLDIVHYIVSAEDVTVIASGTTTSGLAQDAQAGLFRFLTEGSTTKYTIKISSCTCTGASCSTSDSCPIRVSSRSQAFPIPSRNGTHSINCSTSSNCELEAEQPVTNDWQYIMVECLQPSNVSFNLTVDFEGCDWVHLSSMGTQSPRDAMTTENPAFDKEVSEGYVRTASLRPPEADGRDLSVLRDVTERNPSALEQVTSSPEQSFSAEEPGTIKATINPSCLRLTDFGRFSEAEKLFSVTFRRRYGAFPLMNLFRVTGKEVAVAAFHMEPLVDNGGTLKLEANLLVSYLNDTSQIVVIELCLVKFRIPVANGILSCPLDSPQIEVSSETGKNSSAKVYIPYPESGVWFVAIAARCYGNVELSKRVLEQCRLGPVTVNSTVSLSPCVDNECGSHGHCRVYRSGVLHFSACQCLYGYRGYGCTDDTEAWSDAEQLVSILLLTLSNLFFIPSIVVSIYRRFYTEAFVYFFTMFVSSFYHACDGENKYALCIMPIEVLQFCDFLASIVSFWVTLVTMARLPLHWTSFSYVVALLVVAIGVEWDKHSLWTFLVPSVVAGLIMIVSWVGRCWKRRTCYPSKRRWLFFIVPGICLALLGLIIFAGLETYDNYEYTHSAWHACMALCIVFLLPLRPLRPIAKDDNLLSICVERQDDGNVVQISVSKDEEWWQPPQSNPFLMTSTNASSNVSANGDLLQKNNSSEGAREEWQPPQNDPLLMTPFSASSVSTNGDLPQKSNSLEGAFEEIIFTEKTVL